LYGGDTPEEAAKNIQQCIKEKATSAQRDVVIANSAFAIQVIESQKSIFECIDMAKESLESGKALQVLNKFVELNS
jgi:anthranilate phosphoribosyltransferase